jgi:hypothetical protein
MFTSRSFSSSSSSTIKHHIRSTRSSLVELPPEEVIRKGTVGSRIRQLVGADRSDIEQSDCALSDWDRSSTQSGWGRKTGNEARIVQPATHRRAIEVNSKLPPIPTSAELRSSFPLGHIHESIGLFERTTLQGQISFDQLNPWSTENVGNHSMMAQQTRVQQLLNGGKRSLSRSQHESVVSASTTADPRESARAMFAQYGIREPPGWLSDEAQEVSPERANDASPRSYWRICHICGARTHSKSFCTSCGHPLCQTCTCALPTDINMPLKVFSAVRPPHLASQNTLGRQPRPLDQASLDAEQRTGNAPALVIKRPETTSLKDNPFLVADRVAKKQVVEPQLTGAAVTANKHPPLTATCEQEEQATQYDTKAP